MLITIDGPAGTGKTTVAKRVAEALGFLYFDTGAMYRSITLLMIEQNIGVSDSAQIKHLLDHFPFRSEKRGGAMHYFIGQREVTQEIRSAQVNAMVSPVAALPQVREALWKIQRSFAERGDAVFEGRDMGTVVFPKADVKIFLTASPEVRAERRLQEVRSKHPQQQIDHQEMMRSLQERDRIDSSRELAPLQCPQDAHVVDTTHLSIDEVVQRIVDHVQQKKGKKK